MAGLEQWPCRLTSATNARHVDARLIGAPGSTNRLPDVSGTVLERYARVLQAGKARNHITIDKSHIRQVERSRSLLTGDRSFNRRDMLEFDATAHTKDDVAGADHPLELEHESRRSEIDATRRYPAFRSARLAKRENPRREFHEFRDSRERNPHLALGSSPKTAVARRSGCDSRGAIDGAAPRKRRFVSIA